MTDTLLTMGDSSSPAAGAEYSHEVDIWGFYIGGDTPDIWTLAQIQALKSRFRLPIFTRSNPTSSGVSLSSDIDKAIAWAKSVNLPQGRTMALDLEEAIDAPYVSGFDSAIVSEGWRLAAYGSKSYLFHNPKPSGGWWPADYTKQPHLYPGSSMTQYISGTELGKPYDLSSVSSSVPLWDMLVGPVPVKGDPHVATLQGVLNSLPSTPVPHLVVDGEKGPLTKGAWTTDMSHTGQLQKGSTGQYVKALQAMLNTWAGSLLQVDGNFGSLTDARVRDMQGNLMGKNAEDGKVGPNTKAALGR